MFYTSKGEQVESPKEFMRKEGPEMFRRKYSKGNEELGVRIAVVNEIRRAIGVGRSRVHPFDVGYYLARTADPAGQGRSIPLAFKEYVIEASCANVPTKDKCRKEPWRMALLSNSGAPVPPVFYPYYQDAQTFKLETAIPTPLVTKYLGRGIVAHVLRELDYLEKKILRIVSRKQFGEGVDNKEIERITLTNQGSMKITKSDIGYRIEHLNRIGYLARFKAGKKLELAIGKEVPGILYARDDSGEICERRDYRERKSRIFYATIDALVQFQRKANRTDFPRDLKPEEQPLEELESYWFTKLSDLRDFLGSKVNDNSLRDTATMVVKNISAPLSKTPRGVILGDGFPENEILDTISGGPNQLKPYIIDTYNLQTGCAFMDLADSLLFFHVLCGFGMDKIERAERRGLEELRIKPERGGDLEWLNLAYTSSNLRTLCTIASLSIHAPLGYNLDVFDCGRRFRRYEHTFLNSVLPNSRLIEPQLKQRLEYLFTQKTRVERKEGLQGSYHAPSGIMIEKEDPTPELYDSRDDALLSDRPYDEPTDTSIDDTSEDQV